MLNTNYIIINKQAQKFEETKLTGKTVIFLDTEGNALGCGTITLDDSVYAALYCDEVHNVTMVIEKANHQDVVTILWQTESEYTEHKRMIEECLDVRMSRQNIKLNRYADDIAAKLANGVRLQIVDAPIESDMVECPECGMMSPKGTMYCMDCGAEL